MKKEFKIALISILIFYCFYINAQNQIESYQYWFDNDYSSQIFTPITPTAYLEMNTAIPVGGLTDGLHIFNIRFQDENELWSSTSSDFFYFTDLTDTNISAYQYWFDNDFNSHIYTTVSPVENLQLNTAIPIEALSDGLHVFNIKFRDDNKKWSVTSSQFFYYQNVIDNNIAAYKYWFDNDINTHTLVAISPTQQMQLMESISIEDIEEGLHVFSISFKDNKDKWSIPVNQYFYKTNHVIENKITAYRYWINDDFDNAIYVPISNPTQVLNLSKDINFPGLELGDYTIHFQFKDSSDNWSLVTSDEFSLTTLSMIENTFGEAIFAYPNPTKSSVNIDLGMNYKLIEIKIFDNIGKMIEQYSYVNEQSLKFNINNNSSGIYFIKITADDKNAMLKFIKY